MKIYKVKYSMLDHNDRWDSGEEKVTSLEEGQDLIEEICQEWLYDMDENDVHGEDRATCIEYAEFSIYKMCVTFDEETKMAEKLGWDALEFTSDDEVWYKVWEPSEADLKSYGWVAD